MFKPCSFSIIKYSHHTDAFPSKVISTESRETNYNREIRARDNSVRFAPPPPPLTFDNKNVELQDNAFGLQFRIPSKETP